MLNRFKNALYGPSGSSDDSSVDLDYGEASLGKKIRGALTRSSSFREDLSRELSRNRNNLSNGQGAEGNDSSPGLLSFPSDASRIQRAKSQILRKPNSNAIPEEDEVSPSSPNKSMNSPTSKNRQQLLRRVTGNGNRNGNSDYRNGIKTAKFSYRRPEFLQLRTDDEIIVSADHQIRPIILPRDVSRLPWKSGYAECINAGKSLRNEDQAACYQDVAIRQSALLRDPLTTSIKDQIPWTYFGIFDGHAGTAVAIAAAAQLHSIISEKLRQVADLLIALEFDIDDNAADSDDEEDDDQEEGAEKLDDEFKDCSSSPSRVEPPPPPPPASPQAAPGVGAEVQKRLFEEGAVATKGPEAEEQQVVGAADEKPAKSSDKSSSRVEQSNDGAGAAQASAKSIKTDNIEPTDDQPAEDHNHNHHHDQNQIQNDSGPEGRKNNRTQRRHSTSSDLERERAFLPRMLDIVRLNINVESLISGALESAFWEMDAIIENDKHDYKMPGGCTAIVSVFILGKLYVCNAGDSRAIVHKSGKVIPMSFDFTPTSERQRILRLALQRPEFLGNGFTHLEFIRRPGRKDLGKQMLYKDAYMTGWSMKTIAYDDLKFPLICGEGKRSRVLATIGVTRGFGDHELRSQICGVPIKPFLTPEPEVRVLDLEQAEDLAPEDVLIMGSDGLWDVTCNEEAAEIVKRSFELFSDNEESRSKYRYMTAAQDLIIHSRGHTSNWNSVWRTSDDRIASLDDISAFVVPLKPYRDEYLEWKRLRSSSHTGRSIKA